jgi:hypothetical protein
VEKLAMWFWISWPTRPCKVRRGGGYFNCPSCQRRQAGHLYQVVSRTYLYGIIPFATGGPVGPESYHCLVCRQEFIGDGRYGSDFGAHALARTWRCFRCNKEVPYEQFDCPHCGYRFEVER